MESFDVSAVFQALRCGLVIPACPLALNAQRKLDERRQRALFRYYIAAGAGGLAVGVHTTQFAIRSPKVALFKPVLELAAEELRSRREEAHSAKSAIRNPQPAIHQTLPTKPPAEEFPSREGAGVGSFIAAAGETQLTSAATMIGIAGI